MNYQIRFVQHDVASKHKRDNNHAGSMSWRHAAHSEGLQHARVGDAIGGDLQVQHGTFISSVWVIGRGGSSKVRQAFEVRIPR